MMKRFDSFRAFTFYNRSSGITLSSRFGLNGKQLLASLLINALLIPLFSLPALGFESRQSVSLSDGLERVNEQLNFFTSTWRSANAAIESWTTPKRSENVEFEANVALPGAIDSGLDTKSVSKAAVDRKPAPAREPVIKLPDSVTVVAPRTERKPRKPNRLSAAPATLVNQLPESEHDSVYSYENNLGSPRGQVEMDSSNVAAAIGIRHRAGVANFSFNVPLASLGGRGVGAGASMTYNSRTWNRSCTAYDSLGECTTQHYTYDVEQSWIAPGFSSGFGYLESTAISGSYGLYTILPRGIVDSDGTRHQLNCSQYSGSACVESKTTDGTFIRASGQVLVSGLAGYTTANFTITYPDGSKVFYAGPFGSGTTRKHYPVNIQDRNGNRIRIAYTDDQSGRISKITDTIDREIKFYYENDSSGNPEKLVAVTIPGMGTGDEIQTARFYYEDLALAYTGKFVGDVTAPSTIRVLKYVYMPSTKTGYKYSYDTNFGMIRKIERFAGMVASTTSTTSTGTITNDGLFAASTEYDYPDGSTALTNVPKYSKRADDWQGRTGAAPETYYNANDPVPGNDVTSTIDVIDGAYALESKSVIGPNGMLRETSLTERIASTGLFSKQYSKTLYTFDAQRNLTKIETTNEVGLTRSR